VSSDSRRVFVTGVGISVGGLSSPEELWIRVMQDRKAPARSIDSDDLVGRTGLEATDASILGRHQLLALSVVESAWRSARLPDQRNRIRGEGKKIRHARFGCVSGTSIGGLAAMEEDLTEQTRLSPFALSRWRANSVAAVTVLRYGLGGADLSLNAASATGAQALFMGASMIRSGMADAVVAVAADPFPTPRVLETMTRNGSVAKGVESMPLSSGRNGMTPVEGAGCLILESEKHLTTRGGIPLAEWIGGECANEAYHLMAPNDEAAVLEEVLDRSIPTKEGIDWISLHATGTPRFDRAEISALKRFFGERLPWITAFKRTTGHALGASGLIEAALLCEGLQKGEVPSWPSGIDPALGLDQSVQQKPVPKTALQVAQGMGGTVVVNLFKNI
jgi:3-oxoacyl-[acyl-carrier-protein] synthase II